VSGGVVAAVADALVMVGLWVSVVVRRVPRAARLPLALLSFGSSWVLSFLLTRLEFARWTWLGGSFAILISIVLLVVAAQLSLPSDSGGGGGAFDDGEGGSKPRRPDPPLDGGGPAEPSWWPEFELDFARYSAQRDARDQEVVAGR
jgi:hypothetical protein